MGYLSQYKRSTSKVTFNDSPIPYKASTPNYYDRQPVAWHRFRHRLENDIGKHPKEISWVVPIPPSKRAPTQPSMTSPSPRLWTVDEDRLLLEVLQKSTKPIKWRNIAELIPNRSGKQCRERYFNHLQPSLTKKLWSPVEEAALFRLYGIFGQKWKVITSYLHGRTNNSTKNRFHHIRRRIEKDAAKVKKVKSEDAALAKATVLKHLLKPKFHSHPACQDVLELVARHKACRKPLVTDNTGAEFALAVTESCKICTRCGLAVPSQQTGTKYCKKTGWCGSCVAAPPYLFDDLLRFSGRELLLFPTLDSVKTAPPAAKLPPNSQA